MTNRNFPAELALKLEPVDTWFQVQVAFLLPQSSPASVQLPSTNCSHTMLWASAMLSCINWVSFTPHRKILGKGLPSTEQLTISPCTSLVGSASLLLLLKKSTMGLVWVVPNRST